jgi:hypothetical protein
MNMQSRITIPIETADNIGCTTNLMHGDGKITVTHNDSHALSATARVHLQGNDLCLHRYTSSHHYLRAVQHVTEYSSAGILCRKGIDTTPKRVSHLALWTGLTNGNHGAKLIQHQEQKKDNQGDPNELDHDSPPGITILTRVGTDRTPLQDT